MTRKFPRLNLPPIDCNVRHGASGRPSVFCPSRRKWVALTPEEWVRQHFVAWLKSTGYPASLIAVEMPIGLNGMSRRCDAVVFDPTATRPLMVIEFKAPEVPLTKEVLSQAVRYNTVLGAPILVISNGLSHKCLRVTPGVPPAFLSALPSYSDLLGLNN